MLYAGESYTKTPITSDKSIVLGSLGEVKYDSRGSGGTAIGMGLATTFVLTLSSITSYLINEYLLAPLELEFLRTISFIFASSKTSKTIAIANPRFSISKIGVLDYRF